MRLALMSLLMIPLTVGCGGEDEDKPTAGADADATVVTTTRGGPIWPTPIVYLAAKAVSACLV